MNFNKELFWFLSEECQKQQINDDYNNGTYRNLE